MFRIILALILGLPTQGFAQTNIIRPDTIENHAAVKNYVLNPSALKNLRNVSVTTGTLTRDTDAGDRIDGVASFLLDTSAQNGLATWTLGTIADPDQSGNCEFSASIKGNATLYSLRLSEGSNTLTDIQLGSYSSWQVVRGYFPCSSATRTVRVVQTGAGDGSAINIGRVFYGRVTTLGEVGVISDWQSYSLTIGSTGTPPTKGTIQTDQARWRRVGGDIEIRYDYRQSTAGSAGTGVYLFPLPPGLVFDTTRIPTSIGGEILSVGHAKLSAVVNTSNGATTPIGAVHTSGTNNLYITYTAAGTELTNPVGASGYPMSTANLGISLFAKAPIQGWSAVGTAVRSENVAWRVDATIAGANPNLGSTSVTSYTGIENGSLTLSNATGGSIIAAQIPCSGTNAPTGTTCSAGNESVGVSFNIPAAGDVLACVSTGHLVQNSTGGQVDAAFQIVETAPNAQTIIQEGKSRVPSTNNTANSVSIYPMRICGTFTFSSAGQKTLRLMYEQATAGTILLNNILADALATNGQRDIHWEVYPVTQNTPAPLLVGSVISNTTGIERIERAVISNNGSTCSVLSQSGSWLTGCTRNGAGDTSLTYASGFWSAAPSCTISPIVTGVAGDQVTWRIFEGSLSTTGTRFVTQVRGAAGGSASAASDYPYSLICMGAR